MFYGSNVWDPVLITAQIVSVQCLFYISLGVIQAITLGPVLGHITVAYIFDWGTLHFKSKLGLLNWASHVANAVAAAGVLAWIVERAKKCLDFSATCYIWHVVFVWWYSGAFPVSPAWWIANCVGFVIMLLLGEWLCVRKEMQDIPLGLHKWGSRKESGATVMMTPLPSKDQDLPPRPRLRTATASTTQRPAAAAGAAGAMPAASSSAVPPVAVSRPGSAVSLQVVPLHSSAAARDSFGGGSGQQRIVKKVLSRDGSSSNVAAVAAGKAPSAAAAAEGDNAV